MLVHRKTRLPHKNTPPSYCPAASPVFLGVQGAELQAGQLDVQAALAPSRSNNQPWKVSITAWCIKNPKLQLYQLCSPALEGWERSACHSVTFLFSSRSWSDISVSWHALDTLKMTCSPLEHHGGPRPISWHSLTVSDVQKNTWLRVRHTSVGFPLHPDVFLVIQFKKHHFWSPERFLGRDRNRFVGSQKSKKIK